MQKQSNGEIALLGMEFFARHGFYEEEQKLGNRFQVDIFLETDFQEASENDRLSKTVNYEEVYNLIAGVMHEPARLLETLANRILEQVNAKFQQVTAAKVVIEKQNPPLGGLCQKARISLQKNFER